MNTSSRSLNLPPLLFCVLLGCCAENAQQPANSPAAPAAAPGAASAAPASAAPATAPGTTSAVPATASFPAGDPASYRAIVDDVERSAEDRALDAGRQPAQLLAFIGVKPGMRLAELGAGGGYTAELLSRATGPSGAVYGQNSKFLLQRYAEKPWTERLAKPIMKNVTRLDRDFDEPLPAEIQGLDAVVNVLFYHDTVWLGTDRARMNQNILRALRPGGVYVILDHSGRAGSGSTQTQSLHRIEEAVVREEITRAGFRLIRESQAWRNPADTRDWSASPRTAGEQRGTSDRFALVFEKP